MLPLVVFGATVAASVLGETYSPAGDSRGRASRGTRGSRPRSGRGIRRRRPWGRTQGQEEEQPPTEGLDLEGEYEEQEAKTIEDIYDAIDREFLVHSIGDEIADLMIEPPDFNEEYEFDDEDEDLELEEFGVFPGPASSADVLKSAALAGSGSWTQRNVLQAGAASAYQNRLSGSASEADFAVLRAARPGITSSRSGPISPGWSKSPWPSNEGGGLDEDSIADAVLEEMGL